MVPINPAGVDLIAVHSLERCIPLDSSITNDFPRPHHGVVNQPVAIRDTVAFGPQSKSYELLPFCLTLRCDLRRLPDRILRQFVIAHQTRIGENRRPPTNSRVHTFPIAYSVLTRLSFTFWVAYGHRRSPGLLTKTFGRIESLRVRQNRVRSGVKTRPKLRSQNI